MLTPSANLSKSVIIFYLCSFLVLRVRGLGISLDSLTDEGALNEDRTLIIGATSNVPFNATQLGTIIGLVAAAVLPLLALGVLGAIAFGGLFLYTNKSDGGYGKYYSSYGNAYRALGLDGVDWEKLSIVDWLALGEESFRKFDPFNLECQKRAICELHQNAKEFGTVAAEVISLMGYLKYVDLFSLPEMIKGLADEYRDAADKGRSLNKDCRDIFPFCEFSIKSLHDKYFGDEI